MNQDKQVKKLLKFIFFLVEKFKIKFAVYEESLDFTLRVHKGSVKRWNLTHKLQRYLKDEHERYIGNMYHKDLTFFLKLEIGDNDKKKFFKYYANEFKEKLRRELFPSSISQVTRKFFSKKKIIGMFKKKKKED